MKQRPAIYDSVLVIGSDRPDTCGLPVARLGGIWAQPNLGLSYLLAALHVIEQGEAEHGLNEVALPAAYLQRHAFEVALKDLIEIALVIKADAAWVAILKDDAKGKRPRQAEVPFIHDVVKIVVVLRQALADIGYDDVPDAVVRMATRLADVEVFEPTRLRYSKVRGGTSFPAPVLLHVGETQQQLEALFADVFVYRSAESNENLITALSHEGMALDQAILRYVPIDDL